MERVPFYNNDNELLIEVVLSKEDADRAYNDAAFAEQVFNNALKNREQENHARNHREKQQNGNESAIEEYDEEESTTTTSAIQDEKESRQTFAVPLNSICHSNERQETDDEGTSTTDLEGQGSLYRWSDGCVLLLLEHFRIAEDKFADSKQSHKKIWANIAKKMGEKGHALTGPQCAAKLRSLKKTYKGIKDHNNKSGNNRRTSQFFAIMDDIFCKKAWCSPVAIASSSGLSVINTDESSAIRTDSGCAINKTSTRRPSTATSLLAKRIKLREEHEEAKKQRHQDRLDMDNKFLALLEKIAEKQ